MSVKVPLECPDCAGVPTNHALARWGILLDRLTGRVFKPLENARKKITGPPYAQYWHRVGLQTLRFLAVTGIGRFSTELWSNDSDRTRVLWQAGRRRGIKLSKFVFLRRTTNILLAEYRGQRKAFLALPRPGHGSSESYDWMDNKAEMKQRFQAQGFPVAPGALCFSWGQALAAFHNLPKPVIIKPMLGSRSRHTTIHISTEAELRRAFSVAKRLSPWVIIEQELTGLVYRATVIGGKLFAVLRREPPHVIGNGRATVRQLVSAENQRPVRQGPTFHSIARDAAAEKELQRQGLSWDNVPSVGQTVFLSQKIGRRSGGSNTDVTDQAHPENLRLFENIGRYLNDPVVGIDFIIADISRSWQDQAACGVIECNAMPFIDLHHYPMVGDSRDAAGALWDLVFPDSRAIERS